MRGGIADGRCISSAAAVTAELRPSALPQTAFEPPRPPASPPRTPSGPPRRSAAPAASDRRRPATKMALSKEQMQVIARNATLRGKTPDTSRRSTPKNSRPNSAASTGRRALETTRRPTTQEYAGLTARPKDDEVVLVCPENTVPGEALFFRDGGLKCKTQVPPNVRPGQRFKVRKSECSVNGQPAKRPPRPQRAQSAPSRRDPKPKAFQAPLNFPEKKPPADPGRRDLGTGPSCPRHHKGRQAVFFPGN